jgi:hypothetical protein
VAKEERAHPTQLKTDAAAMVVAWQARRKRVARAREGERREGMVREVKEVLLWLKPGRRVGGLIAV